MSFYSDVLLTVHYYYQNISCNSLYMLYIHAHVGLDLQHKAFFVIKKQLSGPAKEAQCQLKDGDAGFFAIGLVASYQIQCYLEDICKMLLFRIIGTSG